MGKKKKINVTIKNGSRASMKDSIIALIITVIIFSVYYYFMLPAFNIQSVQFWFLILGFIVLLEFIRLIICGTKAQKSGANKKLSAKINPICGGAILIIILVLVLGGIFSTKFVNSKKYSSILQVKESDFNSDIVETSEINDIALMDTDSARILGERAVGSLSDVVSQFKVSDSYSQIDLNGSPMKVAPLEYDGFFKFQNNKKDGIPGYVLVDPITNEAQYIKLDDPIKYSPSAYFSHDLKRHLRTKYKTEIFEDFYFEIDNEGNPYYICPAYEANAGLFGAYNVKGIVICDACSGEMKYYDVSEVPQWVDRVYDGALLQEQYDWYGTLSGGFINSKVGNKGCKKTTDDYGYKVIDGDVWIYTGVTSVNKDESNIGFVMINSRTAEAKYYSIAGAEEYSAMSSAEGQVQHLGYTAAFPSLINIENQPTYIMVLKDNAGLVKMYALVNVEKYNIVATGATQREALSVYKKLLKENGVVDQIDLSDSSYENKDIVVEDIRFIDLSGDTYAYITDESGNVYKQEFASNEKLILIKQGDYIKVYYEKTEESEDKILNLVDFETK